MRPVIVHHLEHCRLALEAGATELMTAPGAAAYAGVGYLHAMFRACERRAFTALLDAGDAPGLALAAWRAGFRDVVFTGEGAARARLESLAARPGRALHAMPLEKLDILRVRDPAAALAEWLRIAKPGAML